MFSRRNGRAEKCLWLKAATFMCVCVCVFVFYLSCYASSIALLPGRLDYSKRVVFLSVGVEVLFLSRRYTYIVTGHD
jgi:hypothetical protein